MHAYVYIYNIYIYEINEKSLFIFLSLPVLATLMVLRTNFTRQKPDGAAY